MSGPTTPEAPAATTDAGASRAAFDRAARHLADDPSATWVDLLEAGLMSPGALLAPERILAFPVDVSRADLVAEFTRRPLGPWSDELRELLWLLRAQTPGGRYVLIEAADGRWQVVRLHGARRPRAEHVDGAAHVTREDAERAVFALRWRDHTGADPDVARGDA